MAAWTCRIRTMERSAFQYLTGSMDEEECMIVVRHRKYILYTCKNIPHNLLACLVHPIIDKTRAVICHELHTWEVSQFMVFSQISRVSDPKRVTRDSESDG